MNVWNERYWLVGLMSLHLLLGGLYVKATPIFEAPDEGYHFAVIHWLAQGRGLPIQTPGQHQDWEQEGSQPPLYYALTAGLIFWMDMSDWEEVYVTNPFTRIGFPGTSHNVNLFRHAFPEGLTGTALAVHSIRWFSLALSLGTIGLTFQLAQRLFPQQTGLVIIATSLVALNPKAIFINASVNNDNLLMFLSTASLWLIVEMLRPESTRPNQQAAGLGVLLGLAALTKISGLVLWPVAALALAWNAWRTRRPYVWMVRGGLMLGLALLISGWWFWRNQQLYGEWLGLDTMIAIAGSRAPISLSQLIVTEWRGFMLSYWGVFGVFTILTHPWVDMFFGLLTLGAGVGLMWQLARLRTWPRIEVVLLGVFCLFTVAGVIRWTLQTPASQGRLLFGAIAPLSLFMAMGLTAPFQNRIVRVQAWVVGAFIVTLTSVAAIIPILYIAPRYAPPPMLTEAELPTDLRPVHAIFAQSIELIGYTSDPAPRYPGETQPITLYWQALRPITADYALALFTLGQATETIGKIDTWPGSGLHPTSHWQVGEIFADSYALPIDTQAATPSLLRVNLKFWLDEPEAPLSVALPESKPTNTVTLDIGRLISAKPLTSQPAIHLDTDFDDGIILLGADVGDQGRFTLYWTTTEPIAYNYTVFVHLLDAQGQQVADADSPPLGHDWPTSAWIPNASFADARQFKLPEHLPPGKYTLRLGLYDPITGERLGVYQTDGTLWPDYAIILNNVIEIK